MDNYIVINGKKSELTEEQLKQLGVKVEEETPFTRKIGETYYSVSAGNRLLRDTDDDTFMETELYEVVNYFNNEDFAKQVALHQLLYRKLLKYAYENDAICDMIMSVDKPKYYIAQNPASHIFTVLVQYLTKCTDVYFSKEKVAHGAISEVVIPFMKEHPDFVW